MCTKSFQKTIDFIVKDSDRPQMAVFDDFGVTYAWSPHQILRTVEEIEESVFEKFLSHARDQWKDRLEELFNMEDGISHEEFAVPSVQELKSKIKDAKAGRRNARVAYALSENVLVNAYYLLNALTATEVDRCYGSTRNKPVMFYGDNTQYLMLPIHNEGGLTVGEIKVIA